MSFFTFDDFRGTCLIRRDDPVEEARRERERGDGGEEPGVAGLALLHVEPRRALAYELGPLADLLKGKNDPHCDQRRHSATRGDRGPALDHESLPFRFNSFQIIGFTDLYSTRPPGTSPTHSERE